MGLKAINPLIKAVAKKAYVAPKMKVWTLEALGLKMEQLTGDVFQLSKAKNEGILPKKILEEAYHSLERDEAICIREIYSNKRDIKRHSEQLKKTKRQLEFLYEAYGVQDKEQLFKKIRSIFSNGFALRAHTHATMNEDSILSLTEIINDDLKYLYKHKKELISIREMQNSLNLEFKIVRAEYNAKSKKLSPNVRKKLEEAVVENESKLAELAKRKQAIEEREAIIGLSEKKIVNKSIKKHLPDVQPYNNQQVINQLKTLKGSTIEIAEQSKNIFLKEMGFSPELVEIKALTPLEKGLNNYTVAFDPISGKILIPSDFAENNMITTTLIWHELDHFSLFADSCKSMGIENFKQMILSKYPKTSPEMFNLEFWNNAIKNAKVLSPEEITKYTKAFEKYELPNAIAQDYTSMVRYYGNPIETRAYDIQASISKGLGINSEKLSESTVLSSISRRILSAISKYEQQTGRTVNLDRRIQYEIEKVYSNEVDIYTILNNVIKTLEKC